MMIGGAITNAIAFSGSNYLFSQMGGNANEERIRHNKAMEELEKAQSEWSKERTKRLDFLQEQEKKEREGSEQYYKVDKAMQKYYYFTQDSSETPKLVPEPKLSDFYTPSEDQKKREIGFIVGGLILTGIVSWGIYKYEKKR